MFKVSKEIHFDAAHRLLHYSGPCHNVHGHRYVVRVTLHCRDLEENMVTDFSVMSETMKRLIHQTHDHTLLLNRDDPLYGLIESTGIKIFTYDGDPTAENMAKYFFELLRQEFSNITEVTVYESPTSYATFTGE